MLVVGIGKYILAIDINKVRLAAPPGVFNSEEPLVCSVMKLPDGINIVGEHEEDVTDLSIPLFVSNHTASASYDGLVSLNFLPRLQFFLFANHYGVCLNLHCSAQALKLVVLCCIVY